ncbi:MAG TPA: hypothetical protein PLD25_28325 [Chloroflexota bacterium]|nr:hypothetical protein [Chloroflexota bacterium]HUM67786.1 hypothetical protein [Chloroflexota bacterium]
MEATVPQWTERFTNTDVVGEDHLGVEGVAQSYQQYLVPGIISTTDHARYYSFYCWILYRYINQPDSPRTLAGYRGKFFKRHELAFLIGCYSHHKDRNYLGGLVGSGVGNFKARRIWDSSDPITTLDDHLDYFGHSQGGFGQYYRPVMQAMGLVVEPESPRWIYRLTHRGEALAQAFAETISGTMYSEQLDNQGEVTSITHDMATEYGQRACLCPEVMTQSADREPLLDAFFRFDQEGLGNPHTRRRLTLAFILDLVSQTEGVALRPTLRRALYLGWFSEGIPYQPQTSLKDWYQRWRMTQVRHMYTATLQTLWAVFLDHLHGVEQISFEAFLEHVCGFLPNDVASLPLSDYLTGLCAPLSLDGDWKMATNQFHAACQTETSLDEMTLFAAIEVAGRETAVLVPYALQILCQLFLRHYPLRQNNDPIWQEVAQVERLPLEQFMQDLARYAEEGRSVGDWLAWLYRIYCLGQHEIIALQKLRYNKYNTFKFYYQDDRFTWANNPVNYQVPLRFPGLRLFNGLTILADLGLVKEDEEGFCIFTADGETFLARSVMVNHAT